MTSVSNIYDKIDTLLAGTLTGYTKVPDPYAPEMNNKLFLQKGYGLAFGDDNNRNRLVGCRISIEQEFVVPLINQIMTTDHNSTAHANAEKSIIEDKFKIIKALENDKTLSGTCAKCLYVGSSAIQYLEGDREKYLLTEIIISTEYLEDLT